MIILDYFIYKIYSFSKNKLGRTNDEALFSAVCLLSVYSSFLVLGIICLIGIIADNQMTKDYINSGEFYMVISIIGFILVWYIRYYKIVSIYKIVNSMQKSVCKFTNTLFYLALIGVPIFSFIAVRLYIN